MTSEMDFHAPPSVYRGTGRPRDGRYLTARGEPVPSVTTIIKGTSPTAPGLQSWMQREAAAGRDPEAVRNVAASAGTEMHALLEQWICEPDGHAEAFATDAQRHALTCVARVLGTLEIRRWLAVEEPLVSEVLRLGGTIDAVAETSRGVVIIDWKTSRKVYPEHVQQAAGYELLYEAVHGTRIHSSYVVTVPKDGTSPARVTAVSKPLAREEFVARLHLFHLVNRSL